MNGGALAHVGFPRPVQQVHIGRALGGRAETAAGAYLALTPKLTGISISCSAIEKIGRRSRIRTYDPLIKRQQVQFLPS